MMHLLFFCIFFLPEVYTTSTNISTSCNFAGFIATCPIYIDNILIDTTALINNCHTPMEITFMLEAKHVNISWPTWQYTFLTSNPVERLKLPNIGTISEVLLDINLSQFERRASQTTFHIEVQYIGPRNKNLGTFLKTTVSLPSRGDCVRDKKLVILEIALGTILFAIAFSVMSAAAACLYKRYLNKKKDPLLENMETQAVEVPKSNHRISNLAKRKRKLAEALQAHYRSRPSPRQILNKDPLYDNHDGPTIMISTSSGLQSDHSNDLKLFLSAEAP